MVISYFLRSGQEFELVSYTGWSIDRRPSNYCNILWVTGNVTFFLLNVKKFLATGKAKRRNWKLCGRTYNSWSFDMWEWGQIDRNKNFMSTTIYYYICHRWKDRIFLTIIFYHNVYRTSVLFSHECSCVITPT